VLEEEVGNTLIRYWHCPRLFIPDSIHEWFKIYKYYKEFPGARMKGIEEQVPRFLKAFYLFEGHLARIQKEHARSR
jgi:hypothetical protein